MLVRGPGLLIMDRWKAEAEANRVARVTRRIMFGGWVWALCCGCGWVSDWTNDARILGFKK